MVLTFVLTGCSSSNRAADSSSGSEDLVAEEIAAVEQPSNNITEMSFFDSSDLVVQVGEESGESYLHVTIKDSNSFQSSDVVFVSENPDIAMIEFTEDALTTYLYYQIKGISPGETYVYASTQDKSVVSEKIRVGVVGASDSTAVESDASVSNGVSTEDNEMSPSDITYIELDELQSLFIKLPSFADREEVNEYITDNGFYVHWFGGYHYNASSCYIGRTAISVSARSRDREGPVIDLYFNQDGSLSKMGYAIGGSVYSFEKFELTYTDGSFHLGSKNFDDGETAMQIYLANTKTKD